MKEIENLHFEVIKDEDLSESGYAEILDFCSRAYEQDYKLFLDTFHDATYVLGRIGNKLVTHALWVTRWLQSGDSPLLRTACVEGVATEECYRRKSLASMVIRKLVEEIQDFDLAVLSPGVPELYAQLGWQFWRGPLFIRTQEGLIPTPDDSAMILRFKKTPALDLDAPLSAEWREGELW